MYNCQNKPQKGRTGPEKDEKTGRQAGHPLVQAPGNSLGEAAHHLLEDRVIWVVSVAHRIRPPQQHLEWDIGDELAQLLQPAPGALVQEAHGNIKGGT